MSAKAYFIEKLESQFNFEQPFRLLDLGSGQSRNFLEIIKKYPNLQYVGIEPQPNEATIAKDLLKDFSNAKIYNQLAYEPLPDEKFFDVCVSLSVLEHVKQIEKFLINSIKSVKSGGYIIHRYDLGHALYPSNLKEKFQIFLGNNFASLLPEKKFVCYLDENTIKKILENNGAKIIKTTYHQMPNHKNFLKNFKPSSPEETELTKALSAWEYKISPYLNKLDKHKRELLFPTIEITAQKN